MAGLANTPYLPRWRSSAPEMLGRGTATSGATMSLKEIRNCDYVVLLCANLARTRGFYKDVMGLALEQDSDRWVTLRVGSTLLTLRPRGALAGLGRWRRRTRFGRRSTRLSRATHGDRLMR